MACALSLAVATTIHARQTLELWSPFQMPDLPSPTWAAHMIGELQREASAFTAGENPSTDPVHEQVRLASINIRLIASDLLAAADRDLPEGNVCAVAAMHLLAERTALDAALAALRAETEASSRQPAIAQLQRFNVAAAARLADGSFTLSTKFDTALRSTFTPLRECFAALEGQHAVSHWIRARKAGSSSDVGGENGDSELRSLEGIHALIEQASLPNQAQDDLGAIVEFLRRGAQFTDLQPLVSQYSRVVLDVLDCAHVIESATWLKAEQRESYTRRIADALRLFREPANRQQGIDQINAVRISCTAIERVTALSEAGANTKPLVAAFERIDSSRPASNQLGIFASILKRMLEYRALESTNLKRDLRVIDRQLHNAYQQAEQALIRTLTRAEGEMLSLADPAFSSLVADQRQRVEDLQRVRRTDQWMTAIQHIDSPSAVRFEAQITRIARGLLDPNRRPDSIAAMSEFEVQLARYKQFPLEEELRSSDAAAIELTGGSHIELLGTLNEARRAWAKEWAEHDRTGEAARRIELLFRLARVMSELASIAHANPRAALLNRWAAWHVEAGALEQPISELASRCKLATASAIAGEEQALAQQLERIEREAPLARLTGRLTRLLNDDLASLPDGVAGAVGKLSNLPDDRHFMREQRIQLALLCRLVAEENHAMRIDQTQTAEKIRSAINSLAEELLRDIDSI